MEKRSEEEKTINIFFDQSKTQGLLISCFKCFYTVNLFLFHTHVLSHPWPIKSLLRPPPSSSMQAELKKRAGGGGEVLPIYPFFSPL